MCEPSRRREAAHLDAAMDGPPRRRHPGSACLAGRARTGDRVRRRRGAVPLSPFRRTRAAWRLRTQERRDLQAVASARSRPAAARACGPTPWSKMRRGTQYALSPAGSSSRRWVTGVSRCHAPCTRTQATTEHARAACATSTRPAPHGRCCRSGSGNVLAGRRRGATMPLAAQAEVHGRRCHTPRQQRVWFDDAENHSR